MSKWGPALTSSSTMNSTALATRVAVTMAHMIRSVFVKVSADTNVQVRVSIVDASASGGLDFDAFTAIASADIWTWPGNRVAIEAVLASPIALAANSSYFIVLKPLTPGVYITLGVIAQGSPSLTTYGSWENILYTASAPSSGASGYVPSINIGFAGVVDRSSEATFACIGMVDVFMIRFLC